MSVVWGFFKGERRYRIASYYLLACSEKSYLSVKVQNLPYYKWNMQLKHGIKIVACRNKSRKGKYYNIAFCKNRKT